MIAPAAIDLLRKGIRARVLPGEGGVLLDLHVEGRPVLAATPWAGSVLAGSGAEPRPAATERDWVERWRGGWQLCFPNAGHANPDAEHAESFHGTASQAPWAERARTIDTVTLGWAERRGFEAERVWSLTDHGAAVTTRVRNAGAESRVLVIAEHLILGGDVLSDVVGAVGAVGPVGAASGGPVTPSLALEVPPGTLLRPLDYAGLPDGEPRVWPGDAAARWATVDNLTPARVTGLVTVLPQRVSLRGPHVDVDVEWHGSALPHALLWQELGVSTEHPWNGRVVALGIEPTSTPHGAGTALDDSLITLEPGGTLEWGVSLSVYWASRTRTRTGARTGTRTGTGTGTATPTEAP